MKYKFLKITAITTLILTNNLAAQEYWYVIGAVKANVNGGEPSEPVTAYDCFDLANVGQIGGGGECNGKLIVDDSMLAFMPLMGEDYSDSAIFTGQITDMNGLFQNEDVIHSIAGWNTSNVTTMANMFHSSSSFNQDISGWDTSNVTTMTSMFVGNSSFNQDLSSWNVSNVMNYFQFNAFANPTWVNNSLFQPNFN